MWFRESARRRAEQLGLSGWVRNRPDAAVEAEIEGPREEVEVFVSWFGHGPADARVETIDVEERPKTGDTGFVVR